jgi:hypothetical protein
MRFHARAQRIAKPQIRIELFFPSLRFFARCVKAFEKAVNRLVRGSWKLGEVQSGLLGSNQLRANDALFDISLPRFVISNSAFGLFASELHFLGYVIDALGTILFLIKPVSGRSQIVLVRKGPFCFYFVGGLNAPCLWHAYWLPSGGFSTRDFTRTKFELRPLSGRKEPQKAQKMVNMRFCASLASFV